MNLRQIETFRWIAKLGSFAAAAQRMNSTQSAVSIRIQELEYALGTKLFDRSHRMTQLTAKGRELLPLADDLIDIIWQLRACAKEAEGIAGLVKIGIADLIGITWLPEYVTTIRERYPKVDLDLEIGLALDLAEKLRNSELDVVLAPAMVPRVGFAFRSLGQVEFVWAANRNLNIAGKQLTPSDVNEFPIITLSRSSYHHQSIEKWFKDGGARCHRVIICNSVHTMLSLTSSGLGIGLLPIKKIRDLPGCNEVIVLETVPPIQPVEFYAMSPVDQCTPLVCALMTLAMEVSTFDSSKTHMGEQPQDESSTHATDA